MSLATRLSVVAVLCVVGCSHVARAANEAPGIGGDEQVKRLGRPSEARLRERMLQSASSFADADPAAVAAAAKAWDGPQADEFDLLDRIAQSAALLDDRAARLVGICSGPTEPWLVPPQDWLNDLTFDPWLRDQLRLYFGRWLAQRKMYDSALQVLAGLEPGDVADPASLLFYQGTAYHHQLRKSAGLRVLDQLLNDVRDCPSRFKIVAGLMHEDLKKLEDDSLDHIARRMDDVRRRLGEGRPDERTRRIEDGIIASLDKMIEEMEKQRQQQQQGAGGGQSSSPMQDSRIARQKGQGLTDRKDIGHKSEWGDLPPETREQIKQQIGRDLPAHYYDLIQQYFNTPAEAGEKR